MQNSQSSVEDPDRSAARAAIVAAARAVAERDGVENLTLGKVATEAGLPRATVYQQFTRKEDILMSIVSDDLATIARSMRGIDWPEGGATPESAVVVSLTRPETPNAEELAPSEVVDQAKDVSATISTMIEASPLSERRAARRAELERALAAKSPMMETVEGKGQAGTENSPTEKSPPRADAWLERRLRVFEKGMASIEARQEQVEKSARAVVAVAEDHIKVLEETVKELAARIEEADARQKSAATEVRTALNEATLRIHTVEGVARAALAENTVLETPAVAPEPVPEPLAAAAIPEPDAKADVAKPVADKAQVDAPKSVIAEVRKSVAAATAAAAIGAEARKDARAARDKRSRTRYMLACGLVLVVFAAAAGMAFSKGVADGRRDAMRHLTRVASRSDVQASTGATPLDQLTARAQAGDATAEYVVANKYLQGDNTAKNPAEAVRWLTLAAAHGLPEAQYLLGTLYTRGIGAPADTAKALQWYEAAALQGNRKSMHALAVAYAQGAGALRNLPEAVRWFSRAAGLGYVDSQFNLAVLYERGDGVPQSLLDAYKWYLVAARNGDSEAKGRAETLRTQLSADDVAAAERAAHAFRPGSFDVAANAAP